MDDCGQEYVITGTDVQGGALTIFVERCGKKVTPFMLSYSSLCEDAIDMVKEDNHVIAYSSKMEDIINDFQGVDADSIEVLDWRTEEKKLLYPKPEKN